MRESSRQQHQTQLFWPRVVMRKWLNISAKDSDYSADPDSDVGSDSGSDSDQEFCDWPRQSGLNDAKDGKVGIDDALPKIRRRKSETFRAQYINAKEIRVCVGTWNVAGRFPPEDLELDSWLDVNEPADIYVIGFQEVIPLNAGNIFGAEDNRPISVWEDIIRESLNKVSPVNKFKSFSDPPSPSRFRPSEDAPDIEEEIAFESDSGSEEEIVPINEECNDFVEIKDGCIMEDHKIVKNDVAVLNNTWGLEPINEEFQKQFPSSKKLDRLNCFRPDEEEEETGESNLQFAKKLTKTLSGTERIGLCWPEKPLDLLGQHVSERPGSFKSMKSLKASKSFNTYSSFKLTVNGQNRTQSDANLLAGLDLEALINRKRKPSYVRIVSKQMVGVFLSVWVRRGLRKHIQNLNVSTVGVGVMGYIGNKGSVSVSMSIYQTFFCFVCTHLTSGEKETDVVKRNTDVHEIHRRTHFNAFSLIGLPKSIHDHERIIWLGDLNYRINLPYNRTRELIAKKDWCKLIEYDQLSKEFKKGRAFDGWSEGTLNFPPTYKYEVNSEKYCGEDPKAGRRNPAWCDRILSFGKGIRLLRYGRSELKFSDHRPVSATYMVEVEVFSPRKLQRALTFTDAEIAKEEIVTNMGLENGMSRFISDQKLRASVFGLYGNMNFTKSAFSEHAKSFKPEDMQVQMEGKNCIVTGANSGIGFATAEGLASRGATVYMVCRNKERGEAALTKIHSNTGNKNVYLEVCDISSVNDVKSFTSRFCSKDVPVHVLVNNAGLLEANRVITPEGYELSFATNVLGTYTLTELMLPLLEKAAPDARVITVSSGGMYKSPLTTDLQFSGDTFDGVVQYGRNKRVQIALTEKWAEKYKDKGVGFYSMHPGWAETPGVAKSLPDFSKLYEGKLRSSEEGADTVISLALQPKEKLVPGAFYFDRAEAPKHLPLTGTKNSHSAIDSIVEKLGSFAGL